MAEEKKAKLREALEEKKAEMNMLLDDGDRTKYVAVEGKIYELKKQIGEPLSNW